MWKKTLVPAIAVAAVGLVGVRSPLAGTDPVLKCLSAKQKAAGKKASGKLGCYAKAAAKATAVDSGCLTKVEDKFSAAFTKADAKGACPGTASAVEASVDQCVNDVVALVPGADKCSGAKLKAAGKKAAGKLACNAKATAKAIAVDPACLTKAEGKYGAAFGKAGACTGDQAAVESDVDDECVAAVVSQLQPPPGEPVCGNGQTETGETCDDGNTVDETDASVHPNPADTCPKTCVIGACGAGTTTSQNVTVHISVPGNVPLGGTTVFLDYPDDETSIPGSGANVTGNISNTPAGSLSSPNDLDYGLIEGIVNLSGFSTGVLFTVAFENCPGATITVGDFGCYVKDASDTGGNDVPGVTCSVSIP
jgi:hypothetical protein